MNIKTDGSLRYLYLNFGGQSLNKIYFQNFATLNKSVINNDKALSFILASRREVIMIYLSFQNFLDKNFVAECQK